MSKTYKKTIFFILIFLIIFVGFYIHFKDDDMGVYPESLQSKDSYEISTLIENIMQPEGNSNFPWTHMSDSEIVWVTEGIEHSNGVNTRVGRLRVNINGEISTVLKKKLRELGWSIMFFTKDVPKWGADLVALLPGMSDGQLCFGSSYKMCKFDIEDSLKKSSLEYEKPCSKGSPHHPNVYLIRKKEKQPITAFLHTEGGSGGSYTMLQIRIYQGKGDIEELCDT